MRLGSRIGHTQSLWEQSEVEERPEPADKEHDFRCDEQDHPVAHVQLHDRCVITAFSLFHNIAEPAEESGDQAGDAEAKDDLPATHFVHHEHHAGGKCQRRKGADQRPDIWLKNVIIVVLCSSHGMFPLLAPQWPVLINARP